jgi:hypothetical protein
MIKTTAVIWFTALVVFVGTLPHTVGATLVKAHVTFTNMNLKPCTMSIAQMKQVAKRITRERVLSMYQSNREWKALYKLWMKESKFDYTANNPHSSAYGIPQILKMDENTPMVRQIELGLKYIQHRYGTPTRALAFHNTHGWY